MAENKKKIYIVLTYSGTILSRIIRAYTGDEYSHVSIALDKDLEEMYSFGRLNPYNPLYAGFVHEKLLSGTFNRFKKTTTEILSITVSDTQYEEIKQIVENFKSKSKIYHFNIIGLFAVGLGAKYKKENYYYCAEFVKYVVEQARLNLELPEIVKPMDFYQLDKMNVEYKGILRDYAFIREDRKQMFSVEY